jgi:hypothetical protein
LYAEAQIVFVLLTDVRGAADLETIRRRNEKAIHCND